jgi:hypothetical protein
VSPTTLHLPSHDDHLRVGELPDLPALEPSLDGFEQVVRHIRDHLPNAKTAAQRDAEILNNEHAIRRWMEGI